jgi:hypothetical protein
MTGIRRALILIGLIGTVMVGSSIPASATFADSVAVAHTVSTGTVAAPTNVSTAGTKCVTTATWNATTGTYTYTTTLEARLSWRASTSPGVTGYVITAYMVDGSKAPIVWVSAPGTSVTGTFDYYYATQNIRVTVTTYTSYGWTKESGLSGAIKC